MEFAADDAADYTPGSAVPELAALWAALQRDPIAILRSLIRTVSYPFPPRFSTNFFVIDPRLSAAQITFRYLYSAGKSQGPAATA